MGTGRCVRRTRRTATLRLQPRGGQGGQRPSPSLCPHKQILLSNILLDFFLIIFLAFTSLLYDGNSDYKSFADRLPCFLQKMEELLGFIPQPLPRPAGPCGGDLLGTRLSGKRLFIPRLG